MSTREFLYKVCNRLDPIKSMLRSRMIAQLKNKSTRQWLNNKYNHMSIAEQAAYHTLYATALDDSVIDDFIWNVTFLGKDIKMPVSKRNGRLEWNTALSIIGHGKRIKQFYSKLLLSDSKPKIFFDVGTNYGTHSLLFMKQGVNTFSFEPNPNCHPLFKKLCVLNGVQPNIINMALSDKETMVDLYFPKNETWLGTIEYDTRNQLSQKYDLELHQVETTTLDNFCNKHKIYPDLIKIDTEGHELSVLIGAKDTLQKEKPIVLFECNQREKRTAIFSFFRDKSYGVFSLPYTGVQVKSIEQFEEASQNDFVAISKDVMLKF